MRLVLSARRHTELSWVSPVGPGIYIRQNTSDGPAARVLPLHSRARASTRELIHSVIGHRMKSSSCSCPSPSREPN
jgi:hypothetical protein